MENRDNAIAIYLLLAVIFLFADLEEEGVRRSGWILSSLLILSIRGDLYYLRSNKEKTTYVLVKKEF